jgi:nucleoside-diphosphate-sugar epimerase
MNYNTEIINKSILVTGCAGFLGQHLCSKLIELGGIVKGIDNVLPTAKNDSIEVLTYAKCDISDRSQVENAFCQESYDLVFHLAAIASPRTCKNNFDLAYDVNVNGTKNVISTCRQSTRVVFMSSASVYGEPIKLPIAEDHPLNGSDPYSITKIIGEHLCHNYVNNYGHNIAIARNFNAFGIGQTTEYIVPTLITQALRNGKIEIWNSDPVRDLLYVDDTIDGLITIANCTKNDVYNIGSGKGTKIGTLAESIRNNIDRRIEIVDLHKDVVGSKKLVSDNSKLKMLGWDQQIELNSGLSRTIDWFRLA